MTQRTLNSPALQQRRRVLQVAAQRVGVRTLAELAHASGVPRSTLSALANDARRLPRVETSALLLDAAHGPGASHIIRGDMQEGYETLVRELLHEPVERDDAPRVVRRGAIDNSRLGSVITPRSSRRGM